MQFVKKPEAKLIFEQQTTTKTPGDPVFISGTTTTAFVPDMVNRPPHYQSTNGLEVIDVIEAFTSDLSGLDAVCTANAIKYICRWKHKNGIEDLKKAKWYIEKLIARKEKENGN